MSKTISSSFVSPYQCNPEQLTQIEHKLRIKKEGNTNTYKKSLRTCDILEYHLLLTQRANQNQMETQNIIKYASKRKRSEDNDFPVLQRKMFVNEKLLLAGDDFKMKEIEKKTVQMLFEAAARSQLASGNKQNIGEALAKPAESKSIKNLSEQVILSGNGEIQLRNFTSTIKPLPLERAKAKCCNRDTFLQVNCQNCTLPVCEHCGYSCAECCCFLCGTCVALFDCGTMDRPLCQNCSFFN